MKRKVQKVLNLQQRFKTQWKKVYRCWWDSRRWIKTDFSDRDSKFYVHHHIIYPSFINLYINLLYVIVKGKYLRTIIAFDVGFYRIRCWARLVTSLSLSSRFHFCSWGLRHNLRSLRRLEPCVGSWNEGIGGDGRRNFSKSYGSYWSNPNPIHWILWEYHGSVLRGYWDGFEIELFSWRVLPRIFHIFFRNQWIRWLLMLLSSWREDLRNVIEFIIHQHFHIALRCW